MTARLVLTDDASAPPLNVTARATEPSSPAANDIYMDDGSNTASGQPGWRQYISGSWADLNGAVGGLSFGAAAIKTLASDVATLGSDRNVAIAAQSGTTDNLIELAGLSVGDSVIIYADTGDTITIKHNDAGATDKILLAGAADYALTGNAALILTKIAAGKVVQAVDQNSGGGSTVYTNAFASAPGSPVNGDWWLPSDGVGVAFARVSGAWVNRGPIFPLTQPSTSGFAWTNQGSATAIATKGALYLETPGNASGNALRVYTKTAPSVPYTITIAFMLNVFSAAASGSLGAGLCFRQSSDGKLSTAAIEYGTGTTAAAADNVQSRKWTNATTYSADYFNVSFANAARGTMFWLRIADDNTSRICYISSDGQSWNVFHTVGRTDFLTANEVGFFLRADSNTGHRVGMQVMHYLEA